MDRPCTVVTILNEALHHVPLSVKRLSIQLDGASENWSGTVLGYAHMLVLSGRFDEVGIFRKLLEHAFELFMMSYIVGLPVGHTHEDIDQVFSTISRALLGGRKGKREVVNLNTRSELEDFLASKVSNLRLLNGVAW